MTALGMALAGLGLIFLWSAWTGERPLAMIREAVGG